MLTAIIHLLINGAFNTNLPETLAPVNFDEYFGTKSGNSQEFFSVCQEMSRGRVYNLKSSPEKLTGLLIVLVCLAGLLYQITDVSTLYFNFFTRSEITINTPFIVSAPYLSLCFRYRDIINFTRVTSDGRFTNQTFKRPFDPTSNESIYFESFFTVQNIFDLTPNSSEFFGESDRYRLPNGSIGRYSCIYRQPGSFIANHFTKEECRQIFSFEKYIQRDFMCYHVFVEADRGKNYDITHASFAKEWFGLMFQIILNPVTFRHATYATVFVHESRSNRLSDSTLTNVLNRAFSGHNLSPGDEIKVSYYSSSSKKLPPPYDTKCTNVSERYNTSHGSGTELILDCVNKFVMDTISHVSPLGQCYDTYDLNLARLSTDYDAEIFERAFNVCHINEYSCEYTSISTKAVLVPSDYFKVSLYWPQDTINQVTSKPRMELVEYLLFMASSVGFWFGFSLFTFLFQFKSLINSLIADAPCVIETNFCGGDVNHDYSRTKGVKRGDNEFVTRKDLDRFISNILFRIRFDLFRQLNERNSEIVKVVLDMVDRRHHRYTGLINVRNAHKAR